MALPVWITPKGSLGTFQENTYQTILLSHQSVPAGDLLFLSGDLPEGLTLNPSLSAIQGTPANINKTSTYRFTLRVQNTEGVADRDFSITITSQAPYWLTDSIIVENAYFNQEYRQEQFFEMFFQIVDPGATNITYEIVAGTIPENLVLESNGRFSGFLPKTPKTYEFRVRATGSVIIEKDFQFVLLNFDGVRPPFWSTLPGWIGNIQNGEFYSFDLTAGDADNSSLTFTLVEGEVLPAGISLYSNGLLQGTHYSGVARSYSFLIDVSDGIRTVRRRFVLRANYTLEDETLYIVQPPGTTIPALVGTLLVDEDSYLDIQAVSNSADWIRYEITEGSLPEGLTLETSTGQIRGTVMLNDQAPDHVFTVRAYSNFQIEDSLQFKITINQRSEYKSKRVSTIITGLDRVKFNNFFFNYVIPYDSIYRPADENFGITLKNEMIIKKYLEISNELLESELLNRTGSMLKPERFMSVPVLSSRNTVICDAVVCLFKDSSLLAEDTFVQPQTSLTVKNASIPIIRRLLENKYAAPDNAYTKWDAFYYDTDIKNDRFRINAHDMYTGKKLVFNGQNTPSPFLNDVVYYAIRLDDNHFRLSNSYEAALAGSYVKFNINDVDRGGILRTYHACIPIVFCNLGKGEAVASALNDEFDKKYYKLTGITLVDGGELEEADGTYIRTVLGGDAWESATVKIVIDNSQIVSTDIINPGRYKSEPSTSIRLSNVDVDTESPVITGTWSQNQISFYDITLYLKYVVVGPTQSKRQEDLEMIWFDDKYLYPNLL